MHQPTSNIDTDPYAEKLLQLVDKATREAVIEELERLNEQDWSDELREGYHQSHITKRLEELSNKEGE